MNGLSLERLIFECVPVGSVWIGSAASEQIRIATSIEFVKRQNASFALSRISEGSFDGDT